MQEKSDAQLLRDYAGNGDEAAFRIIVTRHTDFVYSAALRQVNSSDLACDLAQGIFCDLARKARQVAEKLTVDSSLAGWLHRSTRYAALNLLRDTRRRLTNEKQAMEQLLANSESSADWERIRPLLDEALDTLDAADREAILLRYFKNQDFRTVGLALGVSDDAAQKRVSRAVDRMREFLSKRNVTIGAGGLVAFISTNAVQSAPIGLALTIANASLAGAGTSLTFIKIATATKLKLALSAIVVAGAVTAFVVQQQNQTKLHDENNLLRQHIAQLRMDNERLSNRIDEISDSKKLSDEQFGELLKLRGEVGVLRRQLDEAIEKNRRSQSVKAVMRDFRTNSPSSQVSQVHIKARFIAMPNGSAWGLNGLGTKVSDKGGFTGILTSENVSNTLSQLRPRKDVETLAEPEVTTTSGRQTQMHATRMISVVTNFCLQETNGVSGIVPQTENVEMGPILDVTPRVLPDGYTIELPVSASVTDFLGYDPSTKTTPAYDSNGQEFNVPTASPQFHIQQATNSVNLLDGQTLFLALNGSQIPANAIFLEPDGSTSKYQDTKTFVFITTTIIDPAGNPVHADRETYTNIPPQVGSQ